MPYFKKLALAPLFLLCFAALAYQLTSLIGSTVFIFSLSMTTLVDLIFVSVLFSLTCFFFILFATLASDLKLVLPAAAVSTLIPFIFLPTQLALILAVAVLVSLIMASLSLSESLKTYLTFKPEALLGPVIRRLSTFLILSFCLIYFFSASKLVAQNGFELPDSLIDTALKVASPKLPQIQNSQVGSLPQISPEQIEMLKKNPQALKQFGLDPSILDSLNQPKSSKTLADQGSGMIKQGVKAQLQGIINPYINFIPAILAILLFVTLTSLVSLLNLLIYPILWLTFFILEKTGFVKYEVEMRQVKKLVV